MAEYRPTAPEAIAEYMEIGHASNLGNVDPEILQIWRGALEGIRLTPQQRLHAGSIDVELAWSRWFEGSHAGENVDVDRADSLLRSAALHFEATSKDSTAGKIQKAQANVFNASMAAHRYLTTEDGRTFTRQYDAMGKSYARVAEWVLQNYMREDDPAYIPLINSLTATMLFHYNPWHKVIPVPGPTRALSLPETQTSWSLFAYVWSKNPPIGGPLRVGPQGPGMMCTVTPAEFGHDDYPSRHGYGTLQALLDIQKERKRRRLRTEYDHDRSTRIGMTETELFVDDVAIQVAKRMLAQTGHVFESHPLEDSEGAVLDAYRLLAPDVYMGKLDVRQIEPKLNDLEIAYRSKQLKPDERTSYAWLQIETATSSYAQEGRGTGLEGQFHAANELFYSAAQTYGNKAPHKAYEARFDAISAEMYGAIANPQTSEETMSGVVENYVGQLYALGAEMLQYLAAATDLDHQQRQSLHDTVRALTACLLINSETSDGYVATPASQRQRAHSDGAKRWDVTLWPLTRNGFTSECYAKIQLADEAKKQLRVHGVHAVPRSDIDPDGQHVVLANLLAKMRGGEIGEDNEAYNTHLTSRLVQAADLLV